jgi:hypothetical protein
MSLLDEKVIQSKEVKKLIDFLVKESKISHSNSELPRFEIVVRKDGSAYAHVMDRNSTIIDFQLQK